MWETEAWDGEMGVSVEAYERDVGLEKYKKEWRGVRERHWDFYQTLGMDPGGGQMSQGDRQLEVNASEAHRRHACNTVLGHERL